MCEKCGKDNCTGFYLFHPKEMVRISEAKEKERKRNPNCDFVLIDSPSSGEIFTKFKELHVLD